MQSNTEISNNEVTANLYAARL